MDFTNHNLYISISTLLWSYYVQGNVVYNLIGFNKKPASNLQPYRVDYIYSQQQCFAKCSYDTKCYSFAIDKDNRSCHIFNTSISHQQLISSPNTEYYTTFRDCQDWYNIGARVSGVYKVNWMGKMIKDVRCNMEIDGGGWLTFQRRFDGSVDFYEPGTWDQYKNGFGNVSGEFWLGNDLLHEITSSGNYYVLVHGERYNGEHQISKYGQFHIDDENNKYRLHFDENLLAGIDSFNYFGDSSVKLNGQMFTSRDQDNDLYGNGNCATSNLKGPFWFKSCAKIRPNGKYDFGTSSCGMKWNSFLSGVCIKAFELMIKRM